MAPENARNKPMESIYLALSAAILPMVSSMAQEPVVKLRHGDLAASIRDNSESPAILSGLQSLFNVREAPEFDAFDPDMQGASAGLNFEHIISGHRHPNNAFSPRHGRYVLRTVPDSETAVELVRKKEDSPWRISSNLRYECVAPHAVDFRFDCQVHEPERLGKRGTAIFFFANYMNDVADHALHFRGIEAEGAEETWIRADAPSGHPDHNGGGTYRHRNAKPVTYDEDHNFKLNSWSYDYPRFTQPFYYGRAANGMVFILMFDDADSSGEEIRFSLFKFKLKQAPRPAWDFQYVLRQPDKSKTHGFRGRLIWKRFVSPEDCRREYETWRTTAAR